MPSEKTRRKARLGNYMLMLRKRIEPELKAEAVSELVETARTTITRMEAGRQVPSLHLMHAILGIYGVTDEERAEAVGRWRIAKQGTAVVEHAADAPMKYRAFRRDESEAAFERTMEPIAIHGLLQTAAYAAAVADAALLFNQNRPAGWEQRATDERLSRQKLLHGSGSLRLHSLIDEGVVRRVVGGPEVMAEQLRHLLAVGAQDNITIQVVPFGAGAYSTMSGPVSLLSFGHAEESDTAYLEHAAGGELVENAEDVAVFVSTFERVSRDLALPPDQSADLIKEVLDQLEGR